MKNGKKSPETQETERLTVPISYLKELLLNDLRGETLAYGYRELETAKDVLNIIGRHGYSIKGAQNILELCKIAVEECTCVETCYFI